MLPSLAVTDCVPDVTNVTALEKRWMPESAALNGYGAGRVALASVEENDTVPR